MTTLSRNADLVAIVVLAFTFGMAQLAGATASRVMTVAAERGQTAFRILHQERGHQECGARAWRMPVMMPVRYR